MAHGVTINEVATASRPAVRVTAGLPVYVGTAPIGMGDESAVNVPRVYYSLAEAQADLGELVDSTLWGDWTLHEAVSAHFSVHRVGPIVCVNVADPSNAAHTGSAAAESHVLDSNGDTTLTNFGVLPSTVVVKVGIVTMVLARDYTLAFDTDGYMVVSRTTTGEISAGATVLVDYDYLDPTGITADDIIGGYSAGVYTGLEVVEQVYPQLRLVPGLILSPKWSQEPTVVARMITIAGSINGSFRAHAIADLSTSVYDIATSADAPGWKTDNSFSDEDLTVCWPKVSNDGDKYHLSTIVACIANLVDNAHDGSPFASPSNQTITGMTAAVLDEDDEVNLTRTQANALNAQGIVTVLNGAYGWKTWGNRTSAYPGNTDPKDAFIPIRRFFNWYGNTLVLTVDRDVDQPGNRRLIDGVLGTIGNFTNGQIAIGALVEGTVEFREDDNPTANMADGQYVFTSTLTPPSPAEDITIKTQYDADALAALFA